LRRRHGAAADGSEDVDRIPVVERLAAGGCGGAVSQLAVYPLHVVRRRLQVQPSAEAPVASSPSSRLVAVAAEAAAVASSGVSTKQMFHALDKDGSGDLCRSEVEPLARRLGMSVEDLWRRLDQDGSGRVSFEEFRRYSSARDAFRQIGGTEG
ncbi:unnamed protein product, partial [Polarella glacialis]